MDRPVDLDVNSMLEAELSETFQSSFREATGGERIKPSERSPQSNLHMSLEFGDNALNSTLSIIRTYA